MSNKCSIDYHLKQEFTHLCFLCLLFLLIVPFCHAQKIPVAPNKVDANQKRQGAWVIWMNAQWQPTNDSTEIVYYRTITYQNDKPVGTVVDHYRNGAKQYEGTLLQDRPEDILDGTQTWYYPSGEKQTVSVFAKGEIIDQKVLLRSGALADPDWIAHHYTIAQQLSHEKKYDDAANEFLKALEHAEAFYSRESEEYADVLDWLSIEYALADKDDRSIFFEEEYVAVRKLIHAQPDTLMLEALESLGAHYRLQGNYPMAKKRLKEFLNLNSRFFQGNHPRFPQAVQTIGSVCAQLREYNSALTYLTDAKQIFDADLENYEYPHLSNVFALASLYFDLGQWTEAEQLLSHELIYLKKKYGEQSEHYITALGLLGRIHVGMSKYSLAENEWKEELHIVETMYGKSSVKYAQILGSLAEIYALNGNIAQADQYINNASKIYEHDTFVDETYLEFLTKISAIYGALGNYHAAEGTSLKRKNLAAQMFGNQSLEYARSILQLSDIAFQKKNWTACEALAKEAIDIYAQHDYNSLNEIEKRNLATLKSRLGTIYLMQYLSKPEKIKLTSVEKELNESIAHFHQLNDKTFYTEIADTYIALATVYELQNQKSKADQYYTLVYDNVRKQWGETHPYLIDVLFMIAKKSELRGDFDFSFKNYQKALTLQQKYVRDVFPYLSETEKEQFYENTKSVTQSFQGFAAQHHGEVDGLTEAWCNFILNQKGIVLHSFNPVREAIFSANDQSIKTIFAQWQNIKNKYAQLLQDEAANTNELQTLGNQLNELEKQLSVRAHDLKINFKYTSVSWKEIQQTLKPDEAAIEIAYVVHEGNEEQDTSYFALVIKTGIKEPQVVQLAQASEAEGRSFKFYRNMILSQQEDLKSYSVYFKTLEKPLAGINTVYFSADGIYHQISLPTLLNPITKKFIADEKNIRVVPSTSWLAKNEKQSSVLKQAVFFAHPDYGFASAKKGADLTRSLDLDNIAELPGTLTELNTLSSLMKLNGVNYTAYEGDEATEETIKKIKSPQVLHVATHGFFLPKVQTTESKNQNPLLRSGLLLANCQKSPQLKTNSEDGILTAFEASTLQLYNTQLVVMSACETGLGEIKNGEGVYGLQRAFFMAGAKQLLMSLWKVDDEATQQFMVSFYDAWVKTKNVNEAYHIAQQAVKGKYPNPYYWGAFVLNGF